LPFPYTFPFVFDDCDKRSSETGSGTEAIAVGPFASDSGIGIDSPDLSAEITPADVGAGIEALALAVDVPVGETGLGAEAPSVQASLTETDSGAGSETPGITASIPISEAGAGSEAEQVVGSIPIAESGAGSESEQLSVSLTIPDSGLGDENVTTPGTILIVEESKGAEFAWRMKPSSPMIDALALPHVLAIRVTDEASIADKKVQGGSLPRRKLVGKHGRVLEIEGWTDNQADVDALEALLDGVRRTFYHPNGDSFGVLVTGFQPSRTVDQYNRRLYRLAVAEAN